MAEDEQKQDQAQPTAPTYSPTHPPTSAGDYNSHTLQCVMEMQRTLGNIEGAIERLQSDVSDQGKSIQRAKYTFIAVGSVFTIVTGFLTWVVSNFAGPILEFLKAAGEM